MIFQSTLPQGERRYLWPEMVRVIKISIHAPARGATCHRGGCKYRKQYFNPRSRKGSDIASRETYFFIRRFQSTLPQGERHTGASAVDVDNPFQSTLPQGERLLLSVSFVPSSIFQSTLPQGERREPYSNTLTSLHFNPRSRKGSDSPRWPCRTKKRKFQSTLPQGERPG